MTVRAGRPIEGAAVCALYGALAVVLLWPLFADPAHATLDPDRNWLAGWFDPGRSRGAVAAMLRDMRLLQWINAWNWHALTTAPLSWFDANMFHPTPRALAYSEHALGKLPTAAPVLAAGGGPVLAFQVDLWLCFVLSGAALYALLRHAGARPAAAFLGGFVYAFAPARIDMLFHSHLLAGQYLPLALLFLDRTLVRARLRDALGLAAALLLHLLCSYYLAYQAAVGLPVYLAGLLLADRQRIRPGAVALALGACALALAAFAVPSWPYLQVRSRGAVFDYSAIADVLHGMSNEPLRAYLLPPALAADPHMRLTRGCYAYVGLVALPLVLLGIASLRHATGVRRRTLVAATLLSVVAWTMALGPYLQIAGAQVPLPYGWLMRVVPGFSSMRVPGRFALLLMLGVSVLAGLGGDRLLDRVRRSVPSRPTLASLAATVLLVAAVAWDDGFGRLRLALRDETPPATRSAIDQRLAALPRGALLEIPALDLAGLYAIEAQVRSARHWQPLITGSSGYNPPTYAFVQSQVRRLPDADALTHLGRMTGLRYVVVHDDALTARDRERWQAPPGLELLAVEGPDRLYRVAAPPAPDLVPQMTACVASHAACDELARAIEH